MADVVDADVGRKLSVSGVAVGVGAVPLVSILDGFNEGTDAKVVDNALVVVGCTIFDVELVDSAMNPEL